jgi:aminopeptidase N
MRAEEPRPVRLADYRPPGWQVDTVELDVALDPSATRVRATLSLRPTGDTNAPAPLILDGDSLTLVSIALDGVALSTEQYVATADRLTIAQPPQRSFRLEIETVVDPSSNTQLLGLYRSGGIYCTQCEAEGFRRITHFLDRPDVMAIYTTRIEAEKAAAPVLLANGNLIAAGELDGGRRHFAVWHDPFPKPSYLFALVGGDLAYLQDAFRTMSGRDVTLRIYVEPGKEPLCGHAMESLKRAMRWDEITFGREYDLDIFMIVAVSDFNMGAMENKGLNIFNDKYVLASPETATDDDFERIEAIVAHEYFHNWTGNRITCRDWFQLCLKEGLTVFRDQEFTADTRSRAVERINDVRGLRTFQFDEDAGPLAHPVRPEKYLEINNFYTTTVYEKGAEVVRMVKTILGSKKFREGMDLYFARHDGQAATIEQFVQCFADVAGEDLSQFMLWYSQAGTPHVVANGSFDPAERTYKLDLAQSVPATPGQSTKQPMVIPLAVGLIGKNGDDFQLRLGRGRMRSHGVLILNKPADTFVFADIPEPPVLSINRGFSAPIKLISNLPTDQLRFLAEHDSDCFNRWQAFQSLAISFLVDISCALRDGRGGATQMDRQSAVPTRVLEKLLSNTEAEPAFVALMLTIPAESEIAREIGQDVDPAAIFASRAMLRELIGSALYSQLLATHRRLSNQGPYRIDALSTGRRSLRNACLALLLATRSREAISLTREQYEGAGNMTDRLAALAALAHYDLPEREQALADFYTRYRDDPLIIDKWFSVQATIPEEATLDRVKTLTTHPAFSFANPNRVRALVHAFAMGNPKELNRPDGAAYVFVVDTVLALDKKNPQLAARLLSSLKSWRVLEPRRRALACTALRRVAAASSLSPDVSDIVQRALAEH